MPDTDRIKSLRHLDHINLDQHIDAEALMPEPRVKAVVTEADKRRIWRPAPGSEAEEFISSFLEGLINLLDMIPEVIADSVFTLVGVSIAMAAVARFVPAHLAPFGMVAMLIIGVVVSVIWFTRYRRAEHLQESVDELQERVIEMEHAISEKLDVLVRNA